MGVLKVAFPPVSLYNKVPFIHSMEGVAKAHAGDLAALRELLVKHNMPPTVCIKLLHIHFHLEEGEIIATHEVDAAPHGKVPFLEPMTPAMAGEVFPCSFMVDDQGDLQAFEYTRDTTGPNLTAHPEFVHDFCARIVQRGLKNKFGIAINTGAAEDGVWTELDYPEKRATFLLPGHVQIPHNDNVEIRVTTTKFPRPDMIDLKTRVHGHAEHSWSKGRAINGEELLDGVTTKGGLCLAGMPLEPGTPFHHVAAAIAAAA
jgi:hypothetical protein